MWHGRDSPLPLDTYLTYLLIPKWHYQEAKAFSFTMEEKLHLSKRTNCYISQIFILLKDNQNSKR